MFPINQSTILYLSLIGVFFASALSARLGWRWRIPLLVIALGLPAALLWSDPPTGEYAGLGYLFVIVPSAVALVIGAVCGSIARYAKFASFKFVAVMVVGAGASSGLVLWSQFVPSSCLEAPLQVRIADSVLHIPAEMRPRIEDGNQINFFGRSDRKSSTAQLCRSGRNGTQAISADTVWITPAANYDEMTAACSASAPPNWCKVFSPDDYRHIVKILIAPLESDPDFPLSYWGKDGSLKKDQQGDLTQGSVCLLPDNGDVTQCWIWGPFGEGSRLTVRTNNMDQTFANMPVEQAREMAIKAREMTLAIIAN